MNRREMLDRRKTQSVETSRIKCVWRDGSYSHRIVEVPHQPRTLAWGGITKTRVVSIADDALYPWQRSRRGHGLVGEMTWRRDDKTKLFSWIAAILITIQPYIFFKLLKKYFGQKRHLFKCHVVCFAFEKSNDFIFSVYFQLTAWLLMFC